MAAKRRRAPGRIRLAAAKPICHLISDKWVCCRRATGNDRRPRDVLRPPAVLAGGFFGSGRNYGFASVRGKIFTAAMNVSPSPSVSLAGGAFPRLRGGERGEGRSLFWRLQLICWGGGGLLGFFFMLDLLGARNAAIVALARSVSGIVISSGMGELYRRVPWRRMRPWILFLGVGLVCLVICLVESLVTQQLFFSWMNESVPPEWRPAFGRLATLVRFGGFFGWSLIYFVIMIWKESVDAKLQASRFEVAARTAELHQLQAQVNPHFLFNALNSILAEKDDNRAVERITQELADYLRYALRSQGGFSPLGVELDQLERYLRVEKSRFEERFLYEIEADAEARAARVPAALVLPLLENACKYGRKSGPKVLTIRVTARLDGGDLRVTVANTGRWLDFDPSRSHGTGLANLRRRLELLAGDRVRLEQGEADGWVSVSVVWPVDCTPPAEKEAAS